MKLKGHYESLACTVNIAGVEYQIYFLIIPRQGIASGDEFYDGHIFRNVTTVQFTRKLFIRAIGQYDTFSNSFNIYPLVSYKFNAFTMFCAGMTRDYQEYNLDESNFYKTTGHQYFLKLQYLFNL